MAWSVGLVLDAGYTVTVANRLFEARRHALLSCRCTAGHPDASDGGCTCHGLHKLFPFKFRDPIHLQELPSRRSSALIRLEDSP
jgi:hypothetical protein